MRSLWTPGGQPLGVLQRSDQPMHGEQAAGQDIGTWHAYRQCSVQRMQEGLAAGQFLEFFEARQLKGLEPRIIPYKAAISACEKGKQPVSYWCSLGSCSVKAWHPA